MSFVNPFSQSNQQQQPNNFDAYSQLAGGLFESEFHESVDILLSISAGEFDAGGRWCKAQLLQLNCLADGAIISDCEPTVFDAISPVVFSKGAFSKLVFHPVICHTQFSSNKKRDANKNQISSKFIVSLQPISSPLLSENFRIFTSPDVLNLASRIFKDEQFRTSIFKFAADYQKPPSKG